MDNRATVVRAVIARVLEDASFIFTDGIDPGEMPALTMADTLGVSLSFSGEKSGTFRVWADPGFAGLLATNMLGIDPAEAAAPEKRMDALKEMVNIIVGNALTELFGDTAVFNLGIPEQADPAARENDCARSDGVWLQAEGSPVLCVLELKE
jgi:hypothetical protein